MVRHSRIHPDLHASLAAKERVPVPSARIPDEEPIVDLAFADTVIVGDLDASMPPTSGILVNDESGHSRLVLPVTYRPAIGDASITARMRFAWARVRYDVHDMHELWDATAHTDIAQSNGTRTLARRLRTLVSLLDWDRKDLLRAGWLGLAVLVFTATLGAIVVRLGS